MLIVGNLIGCIFWGALIAAAVVAVLWGVCHILHIDVLQNPLSLIVIAVLFLLLGAQSTFLVGAYRLRGYADEIAGYVNSIVDTGESSLMTIEDVNSIRQRVIDEYPVAKPLLEKMNVQTAMNYVESGRGMVGYVSDSVNGALSGYMLRRWLWMMGFVLLAIVFIFATNRRRDYTYDYSNLESSDII